MPVDLKLFLTAITMTTRDGQLFCHFVGMFPQTGLTDGQLSRRGEDSTQSARLSFGC